MLAGRRLAFDFGSVRIGVAVSDATGILASPLQKLNALDENLAKRLIDLYEEYQPIYVVVGDPMHLSGVQSEKSKASQEFAALLKSIMQVPIYLVDERLSTVSALGQLHASGKNAKSSRQDIDSMAAVVILESALAQENNFGAPRGRPL